MIIAYRPAKYLLNQGTYMRKKVILAMLALPLAVMAPQISQAQGTVYVSSLGLTSTGSSSIGSDSLLATDIYTGPSAGGYLLNSIQFALADAVGNPSGFTAMLYTASNAIAGDVPGSSLGTLSGSLSPVTGGIYTYTPALSLMLAPNTGYYIVLTAGTPVANGAYEWSFTSTRAPNLTGGWNGNHYLLFSSDGSKWGPSGTGVYAQFAISATAIPEPSSFALLAFGSSLLLWRHRVWRYRTSVPSAGSYTPSRSGRKRRGFCAGRRGGGR